MFEKKQRVFSMPFWQGFFIGAGLFVLANVFAYLDAAVEYGKSLNEPTVMAPVGGYPWGFPFHWEAHKIEYLPADWLANILVLLLFSFVCGVAFRRILMNLRSE